VKLRNPGLPTTVPRKFSRIAQAVLLSLRTEKSELLAEYLNSVYLGASVYGIPAAATYYFDKSAKDLSCSEAFFLAERIALPNNFRIARVRNILARMPVLAVLGPQVAELPSVYGHRFGDRAKAELETVVSHYCEMWDADRS
jgi:membrane carboxypeptidase/penicillin-binding protein PbpC